MNNLGWFLGIQGKYILKFSPTMVDNFEWFLGIQDKYISKCSPTMVDNLGWFLDIQDKYISTFSPNLLVLIISYLTRLCKINCFDICLSVCLLIYLSVFGYTGDVWLYSSTVLEVCVCGIIRHTKREYLCVHHVISGFWRTLYLSLANLMYWGYGS